MPLTQPHALCLGGLLGPLLLCAGTATAAPSGEAALRVTPAAVEADLFFSGQTERIEAHVPAGSEVAVVCTGGTEEAKLKKKGKVWGVLWMGTEEVTLERVPSLYALSTSAPLASLAPAAVLHRLSVGYSALAAASLDGDEHAPGRKVFDDFVKLKGQEGVYSVRERSVELSGTGGQDDLLVRSTCAIPARVPVGRYEVRVLAFRDGKLVRSSTRTLEVRQVRLTRFIAGLAKRHGVLYGVFSVLLAIVAGLVTGLLFGMKSKRAH